MKKAAIKATGLFLVALMASVAVMPAAASAMTFDRQSGLSDLFVLDKLFSRSGNSKILEQSNKASLGNLFILDRLFPVETAAAPTTVSLGSQLSGRILIQTEANGEAWYVNPATARRVFLGTPNQAFSVMAQNSVGITNANYDALSTAVPSNLRGRFILKTEDNGKLYYVSPSGTNIRFIGGPADAIQLIKDVGLGITNSNIARIAVAS